MAIVFLILIAAAAVMSYRSRRTAINPDNVNAKTEGRTPPPTANEPEREQSGD